MLNGVVTRLKAVSGVTGRVNDRIFEVAEGRKTSKPFVRVSLITSTAHDDKDGASDLDVNTVQVDVFSERSASEARQIAGEVRTALERYSGTSDSIAIQSIRYLTQTTFHSYVSTYPGEFMHSQDYLVRVTNP